MSLSLSNTTGGRSDGGAPDGATEADAEARLLHSAEAGSLSFSAHNTSFDLSRNSSVVSASDESVSPSSVLGSGGASLDCSLPLSPLSRDISLPLAHDLHHSFSQPELYRLAFSPTHRESALAGMHNLLSQQAQYTEDHQLHDLMYDDTNAAAVDDVLLDGHGPLDRQTGADGRHASTSHSADGHIVQDTSAEEGIDAVATTDGSDPVVPRSNEGSPLLLPSAQPNGTRKRGNSVLSDRESDDELPELSRWQLIGLCLPSAAVMVGWGVGEALLLPYLLSLGVSPSLANLAFLINPLFGLFLQPMFGRWSDECTLRWGRRRPFLLLFCAGSVLGLTLVVWSAQAAYLLSGGASGKGSLLQVSFVFGGFAVMDLSHDLLLMPARALLNDRLPDEQTDQGNAYFASISSLGSCLGLGLTIIPLEKFFPWSLLQLPVRATFLTASVIIAACNITTLVMSAGIDEPFEVEGDAGMEVQHNADSEADERTGLLSQLSGSTYGSNTERMSPALADETRSPPVVQPAADSPDSSSWLCFSHNPLAGIGDAFTILPRPLKFVWLLQLVWWYCALHVNLWWTSWITVELYGGSSPETSAVHEHGNQHNSAADTALEPTVAIRLATVGLLIQAVLSFPSSAALPYFNRRLGITNFYHLSAIAYGAAVCCIGLIDHYYQTLIVMAVCGLALPPIFSSSYILVEVSHTAIEQLINCIWHTVYASEANEEEEDEDGDDEDDIDDREEGSSLMQMEGDGARALGTSSPMPLLQKKPDSSDSSPRIVGVSRNSKSSSRRPSHLQVSDVRSTSSPIPDSAAAVVAASPVSDASESSGGDANEFTTATLDSKRGTITALFNITMIIAQTIVGIGSGFLIDYFNNITVVFYLSGALLVSTNVCVLSLHLSKPPSATEPEPEEQEDTNEQKLAAMARQQTKKLERLSPSPRGSASAHVLPPQDDDGEASPHLGEYLHSFESVPHVAPGVSGDVQWVRPLGEKAHSHHHAHAHAATALPRQRAILKRSLSAPDAKLAQRFLRKRKQGRQQGMGAPRAVPKAALFQPHAGPAHGMSLGMRRDLLRGGRPRLRTSRTAARGEDGGRDAGTSSHASEVSFAQQQAIDVRHAMRTAHHKRLEEQMLEQLRERARLFGIQVATRAAQIKAHRAGKHRKEKLSYAAVAAGKRSNPAGTMRAAATVGQTAPASGSNGAAENDRVILVPLHPAAPSTMASDNAHIPRAPFHADVTEETKRSVSPPPPPSVAAGAAMDRILSGGPHSGVAAAADFDSKFGRLHWSVLGDTDKAPHRPRIEPTGSGAFCLPPAGSAQEHELIEQLAEASLAREQQQARTSSTLGPMHFALTNASGVDVALILPPPTNTTGARLLLPTAEQLHASTLAAEPYAAAVIDPLVDSHLRRSSSQSPSP